MVVSQVCLMAIFDRERKSLDGGVIIWERLIMIARGRAIYVNGSIRLSQAIRFDWDAGAMVQSWLPFGFLEGLLGWRVAPE
jgi:hypothetical protein